MTQFENWALSPNGGNWAFYPTKETATEETLIRWEDEKIAFNAGMQAERERINRMIEAQKFLYSISQYSSAYNDALNDILRLINDKTESNE